MKRLRQLLVALGLARENPEPSAEAPTRFAANWTAKDQGRLLHFLSTETGQSLQQRLRCTAYHNYVKAGQNDGPDALAAFKKAAGYMEAVEHLESLSRVSLRDIEDEQIATRRPEGEPELREAYAP